VRTLCNGNPYIERVELAPGATLAPYRHDIDALYLVFSGAMEIDGEGSYDAEEIRWVPASHTTTATVAGAEGADLIVIGIGGVPTFQWA